jgi:hypothetical protein
MLRFPRGRTASLRDVKVSNDRLRPYHSDDAGRHDGSGSGKGPDRTETRGQDRQGEQPCKEQGKEITALDALDLWITHLGPDQIQGQVGDEGPVAEVVGIGLA